MDIRVNDVRAERQQAVAEAVAKVRAIERGQGINPAALDAIKAELLKLAARREMFPMSDFPMGPQDGNGVIYRLNEDPDHRFALYASVGKPGKGVHPHDHTTWAVIVGVHGDEHNVFYERADDGKTPGKGALKQTGEAVVSPGTGVTLMPDDIHSIFVTGEVDTVHLHMYGLALEQLHERVMYDTRAGTYKVFPATQNIKPI
ncbi:MAG TPA: cysteine dioxygenase [Rhodospirillales bacterium]|jgi:predicted metal-dependent enzyme (double-stranded beta helix superfamily)